MWAQVRYDAELAALRNGVERVVVELVVGPKSTAATRNAILPHVDDLAAFLGRRSHLLPRVARLLLSYDWSPVCSQAMSLSSPGSRRPINVSLLTPDCVYSSYDSTSECDSIQHASPIQLVQTVYS